MKAPRVTLDQWRTLQAVVDEGGFAQAAEALHRSQSSVSYAVQKLQEQLGLRVLEVRGRKAELTEAGAALLARARGLVQAAVDIEALAHHLDQGWEAEIQLVVDAAFPSTLLMQALKRFRPESRGTRVQLVEEVLTGTEEALLRGEADLAIAAQVPPGFLGERLIGIEFIAVAHPQHPLAQRGAPLTAKDLEDELQVSVRDSGVEQQRDVGWLSAAQRWSVTSLDSALDAIAHGLGFGWLPAHKIAEALARGRLTALPLREGQRYMADLYLVFGEADRVGPATARLAEIIRAEVTAAQAPPQEAGHSLKNP